MSAWDVRNGVILCRLCHLLFDAYLWTVGPDGGIVVAAALLHDSDSGVQFTNLAGKPLRHAEGSVHWPSEKTWAFHRKVFDASREERHAEQDTKPFVCEVCRFRFRTEVTRVRHSAEAGACSRRMGKGRKPLWTPLEKRAFPAAVARVEAQDLAAVTRRLSLVDEGDVGPAGAGGGGGGAPEDEESSSRSDGSEE